MKLGKRWKEVRRLAVARDKQCLKCGILKPLSVHHLLPKSLYPEKTFDLNNLRTLCCNCHMQLHREIALVTMCPGNNYFDKWLKSGQTVAEVVTVSEANVVEAAEDVWVIDVARGLTKGIYRAVEIEIRTIDGGFEIYLDSNLHDAVALRSPIKALTMAKAAVDEIKST